MTGRSIRLIQLEDNSADAELNLRSLRSAGFAVESLRVDRLDDFARAIAEFKPDIVLADYSLPGFYGSEALRLDLEGERKVPFIFVTGYLGEEQAVELMKQGAKDFVFKDKLSRLPQVVERALREADEVARREAAELSLEQARSMQRQRLEEMVLERTSELQRSKDFSQSLIDSLPGVFVVISEDGGFLRWNHNFELVTGYRGEEVWKLTWRDASLAAERVDIQASIQEAMQEGVSNAEVNILTKGGAAIPYFFSSRRIDLDGKPGILGIGYDISHLKAAMSELRRNQERTKLISAVASAANSATTKDEILTMAVTSLARYAKWPVGFAYRCELEENGEPRFVPTDIWYDDDEAKYAKLKSSSQAFLITVDNSLIGKAYKARAIVRAEDIRSEPGYPLASVGLEAGITSAIAFPLLVYGEPAYVIEYLSVGMGSSVELLTEIVENVSVLVQTALERISAEERSQRLSAVIEQSPSGVVLIGPTGRIDYANPSYLRMSGYSFEEVMGKDAFFLGIGLDDPKVPQSINETVFAGGVWQGELKSRRKNGEAYWERVVAFPIFDKSRRVLSFVAIIDDVTSIKKIESDLLEAKAQAERANAAKGDFLAQMSHEIRTPMNAVIGLTNLALRTELNAKQRDYLGKIQSSSNLLLDIINDILDLSKIDAQKMELESAPFDLEGLLRSLWAVIGTRAAEKNLELRLDIAKEVPKALVGDSHRLGQILLNLLINAVKFTEAGSVTLSVSRWSSGSGRVQLDFLVRDTGIGMSVEQMAKLFNPFIQAEKSTAREYGGSGLGLAICKALVELMGGSIALSSEPNQGSQFRVRLPFELAAAAVGPIGGRGMKEIRILVAEGDPILRVALIAQLRGLSFGFVAVDSGGAAIELIDRESRARPFDLILAAGDLPDMTAAELTQALRRRKGWQTVPAIIIGEKCGDGTAKAGGGRSLDTCLPRSARMSAILDAAINALGHGSGFKGAPIPRQGAARARPALRGTQVLVAEDNEINQMVVREVLESAGIAVELAGDGKEAIAKLRTRGYDAVLMDIQMPVMDGIEATLAIKADPELRSNIVIAMTADVFSVNSEPYRRAGFDDFLFKPVNEGDLMDALERWIDGGKAAETSRGPAAELDAAAEPGRGKEKSGEADRDLKLERERELELERELEIPELEGINRDEALARLLGNKRLYRELLLKFRTAEAPTALRLQSALAARDIESARSIAHALRGVAGNIGAMELHTRLIRLELALKEGDEALASELAGLAAEAHRVVMASIDAMGAAR